MMRFRNLFLLGGSLIILLSLFFSDPNGGAMTYVMLQQLATPVMAVGFAHLARRALFDYMDFEKLLNKALETSQGAAIAFAGVRLIIYGLLGLFGGQVR
jgi:hypothetical protein